MRVKSFVRHVCVKRNLFIALTVALFAAMLIVSSTSPSSNFSIIHHPLQYVPENTLRMWRTRDFLVVFGIPSEDIKGRRRRRNLQRKTCWQYAGVATKENKYNGSMLVLYILGRNPAHHYVYTEKMLQEAEKWNDAILLDMDEGKKTINKKIGELGDWGFETAIGMSRKTFFWFNLALRIFPRARYVAKGDDDMFLRVPQYLADFDALPPRGVYWGNIRQEKRRVFGSEINVTFAVGRCYTLERSVADAFASYGPLQHLAATPYNETLLHMYQALDMRHEDVMVGLVLMLSGFANLTYVWETSRFVDYFEDAAAGSFNEHWVVVHHTTENDYKKLIKKFANVPVFVAKLTNQTANTFFHIST